MIRVLVIVAVVSFVLAAGCFGGAFALVGGPFSIDDHWRFHREQVNWSGAATGSGGTARPMALLQSS